MAPPNTLAVYRSFSLLVAAVALCASGHASAAEPGRPKTQHDGPGAKRPERVERRPNETSPKRAVPDYDGRGDEPTTAGNVLLWGPRIVLAPLYLVSEFLIRRPLGWAIAGAERAGLPAALYDIFAFGPNHDAGFFPTAYVDFGFRSSVGLYTFWDNAFFSGHDLRLRGSTGGKEWLIGAFTERFHFAHRRQSTLTLQASALRRPDFVFFGLGPDTRKSARMRYGEDRLEAGALFEQEPSSATLVRASVAGRGVNFRPGGFGGDPRLSDAISGGMPAPDGYEDGYSLVESNVVLWFDQRRSKPQPPAGVFVGAAAGHAAELRGRTSFATVRARAGGFVNVNGRGRVVSLSVATGFADPIGHGAIPFTELITLGGEQPMRAFLAGRLLDRSALAMELSYRWPVWIWLEGTARAEVGNVFGEHLAGLSAGKLRFSGTLGVESTGSPDGRLEILIGAGSETFESGGKIDTMRFVIGSTHGL